VLTGGGRSAEKDRYRNARVCAQEQAGMAKAEGASRDQIEIVWLPPGDLVPYERNTKMHPPEQVEAIARQIREHGFDQPIVLNGRAKGGREIIKGHGRTLAALSLGLAKVPCIVRVDLSAAQVRAMRIADNKVAESPWDFPALRLELGDLIGIGSFDIGLTGFGPEAIAELLAPPADLEAQREVALQSLSARFGVPPFSVLRASDGWWQDRKRAWISLGIESEVGRGENLLQFSEGMLTGYADQKGARPAVPGNGKQPSSGAHADMAYMKKKNAAAKKRAPAS
jgi:hypothetical protein